MVRGEVVGYACYLPEARTFASIQPSSEIMALYILKKIFKCMALAPHCWNDALKCCLLVRLFYLSWMVMKKRFGFTVRKVLFLQEKKGRTGSARW